MNLLSGEIAEIYPDAGARMAKVQIGGAFTRVPLLFLPGAKVGDHVLVERGVAIALIQTEWPEELRNVLGDSREGASD